MATGKKSEKESADATATATASGASTATAGKPGRQGSQRNKKSN